MSGESVVLIHYVDRRPETPSDTSRCLCILGGDRKAGTNVLPVGQRTARWTLNRGRVTCPQCLEWIHA